MAEERELSEVRHALAGLDEGPLAQLDEQCNSCIFHDGQWHCHGGREERKEEKVEGG